MRTFADQAVIAIENSRLFHELEESNREVSAALELLDGVEHPVVYRSNTGRIPVEH